VTSQASGSVAMARVPPLERLRGEALRFWRLPNSLFEDERRFELIGVMTLLVSIFHLVSIPELNEVVFVFAIAGVLDRRLLRWPAFWFALSAGLIVNHFLLWHTLDNHKYLLTYWCLALGISRLQADSLGAAALNGRLLIGLCFLFAAASKLLSPEYMDGTFFHYTLLTDRRFSGVSDIVGGVTTEAMVANGVAMRDLARPYGAVEHVALNDGPRIAAMAQVMTWWTVVIEGLIALLFLLPRRLRVGALRDAVLLIFMFTTYPVATVVGFGRVLTVAGLAQTENRLGIERALYLAAFVLLPAYRFPFARVFRWFIG